MYANARNNEHGRYLAYQTPPPPSSSVPAPSNVFRNAEERGAGPNSRQRMSLLPPPQQQADYHGGTAPLAQRNERQSHQLGSHYGGDGGLKSGPPMSDSPPCKKPRLGDSKPDTHLPLRIDTDRVRSGPAYNPQVEAISPTLPSESIRDESPLRSTKEDLLLNIARVDREIAKTESQIAKLKKKKIELEDAATQPQKEKEDTSNVTDSVMQSVPQSIYAENRKKAAQAHHSLKKLGPHNDLPLYNQPSDTPVYHENISKYNEFKSRLLLHFRAKQKDKEKRDNYLTKTYAQLSIEWARNIERIENTPKKKAQEAKKRELFEKVFPELRKQREDKERFSRVSRIKSDADLEEIMDGLHEQEMEDKKMRSYAVIPPALLDSKIRNRRFTNTNGLIEDPMQEYKDKQFLNLWTDQEKDMFKEKYLQHPKNFGIIKSYLDRKCIPDCVLYYYLSKKTENYRQLLRKSRTRPRTRGQQQNPNNNNNNTNVNAGSNHVQNAGKLENNGVTTRQQKEQKTDSQNVSSSVPCSQGNSATDGLINNTTSSSPTTIVLPINSEEIVNTAEAASASDQFIGQPRKKHKEDTKENDFDSSDDDMGQNGEKGGPHTCVCCKTQVENFLQSRLISRNQASMYGLNENDIQPSDRVCISCKCKAVRRRTKSSQCPIPTCPAKRARIKRLRPFPAKWTELDEYRRSAIIAKYQIPENCTKCCTACFNRINRRMAPNASLDTPDDPGCDTTRWSDEEIEWMKKGLSEFGTDWVKLSERIPSKSELQCRNFFINNRKKYGFEALIQELKKTKGGHGPPTLTDEEESGSTTSSCDETGATPHDQVRPSIEKKQDDYDSSATVSAEEGVVETDKPNSHEDMKIFPNNPGSPISITIRSNNLNTPNSFIPSHKQQLPLNQAHNAPGQGLRPNSPGRPHIPSVSITPRHPGVMHHQQIGSPSPHQFLPQNFSHGQPSVHPGHGQPPMGGPQHHMPSHQGPRRYPSPDDSDQEPMKLKVNDLLQATIEHHLRKKPSASNNSSLHPGPSISPTITSILKSQDRSHLPPPGTQPMLSQIHQSHLSQQNEQTQHHPQISVTPSMFSHQHPGYYGPAKVERMQQHHVSHEGLSLIQVPPRDECGTLDLSMKKRSPSPHMASHRPPSNGPPPAHQPLDFAPRQQSQNDMYFPSKFSGIRGRPGPLPPPPAKTSKPPPPPLTKPPSLSPMKDGSITHGTPLHHPQSIQTKYEMMRPKEGSITQGTPMEKMRGKESGPPTAYIAFDRSVGPEYYKRVVPGAPYYHGSPSPFYGQRPPSTGQRNSPPTGHPSTYASDQHNNSRQIIMNDYYTSQQMQNPPGIPHSPHMNQNSIGQPRIDPPKRNSVPANMSVPGNSSMYAIPPRQDIAYRQSPSPSMPPHQQQRQGVIQRTNSHRVVVKLEPGRDDAFARLVDAAVSAPSLPVPNPKEEPRNRVNLPRVDMVREGLGKSMAEIERNRNGQPSQQPPPNVLYRQPPNAPMQQPQHRGIPEDVRVERMRAEAESRYNRDGPDTTLTAASLIDAIITHQINQPSPNDRQSPAPSRSDRLFASFQRPSQTPISHSPVSTHNNPPHLNNPPMPTNMHIDEKPDDINHKNPQGGTWGEHINLIISNDYALGKGSGGPSSMGETSNAPPTSQQQHSAGAPNPSHSPKKEDAQAYNYGNGNGGKLRKLRLALQREKEQLQQKESHPDERHITRVAQTDDRPSSRPPSHPASVNDASENGSEDNSSNNSSAAAASTTTTTKSGTGVSGGPSDRFAGKSPLEYVNQLIMEKMRTENVEEKGEEEKPKLLNHEGNPQSQGNHSQVSSNYSGTNTNTTSQENHIGGGSLPSSSMPNDDRSPSDLQRSSDTPQDKKEEDSRKIEESDSPASMIIDESTDEAKDKSLQNSTSEPTSTVSSNQPNYEPLTDEES